MKPYRGDWKNAEDYPPIGCSDHERLAWEFIRRNANYAKEVERMAPFLESEEYTKGFKLNSESILDGVVCWPQAQPGETAKQFYERMRIAKVKNSRIDRPANTFHNTWSLKRPVPPETEYESGQVEFYSSNVGIFRNEEFKPRNVRLMLHPNEVAVRFRLDLPLTKQLSDAKRKLKDELQDYKSCQKILTKEQKTYVSIENKLLTQTVFENAHYWLRCFDADQLPKTKNKNLKSWNMDESGPEAQKTQFNAEIKQFNAENIREKKRDPLELGTIKGYLTLAEKYISSKQFHLMFKVEKKRMPAKKRGQKNELLDWPPPLKSDNESSPDL